MRITRLYLRNFRVYEEPVELEMPPGLVGIFGRNGSGKSTLLESITWTMWGRARTAKDQIRTSGTNADCITEVEFEHEGHLYLVRRTISGVGHVVRAQAHADGSQVAEGVRDVARYVHSVLGMDDVAFRASVFAEQKQLAAFSSHAPAERRKLVMQLLGVTPLDAARDQARRDAKAAAEQLSRLRGLLPDRAVLSEELVAAVDQAGAASAAAELAASGAGAARLASDQAEQAFLRLADVGRAYDSLVKDGKALRDQREATAARLQRLTEELEGLDQAGVRLAELAPEAQALEDREGRLGLVRSVGSASAGLARVEVPDAPEPLDAMAAEVDAARDAVEEARARLGQLDGRVGAAAALADQAIEMSRRSRALSGEQDCPLCGQALGEAFEKVQSHREAELQSASAGVAALESQRAAAAVEAESLGAAAKAAGRRLESLRAAWVVYEKAAGRRQVALEQHAAAISALGRAPSEGEEEELAVQVERSRSALAECSRLRGRLERQQDAAREREAEAERLVALDSDLENLRDKVRSLGFRPEELGAVRETMERQRAGAEAATAEAQRLSAVSAAATATAEGHRKRLTDAEEQHGRLGDMQEETRHLGRLSELLNVFRNTVVASVGPRLSVQAAELFSELTDREYDRLEVDPDTYEIQILDGGVAYGMDRFSGSETDLANLALRVAISEQIRFQSGGAVGLLVLDEVFGPLDEERKERMLLALERLKGRFRQVLVVTHATDIKEQLPSAIEVVKLPGRRATARLLNA